MYDTVVLAIGGGMIAIIGYFLNRFFNSMDRLEASVQDIKTQLAAREQNLKQANVEIHTMRKEQARLHEEFTRLKLLVSQHLK